MQSLMSLSRFERRRGVWIYSGSADGTGPSSQSADEQRPESSHSLRTALCKYHGNTM